MCSGVRQKGSHGSTLLARSAEAPGSRETKTGTKQKNKTKGVLLFCAVAGLRHRRGGCAARHHAARDLCNGRTRPSLARKGIGGRLRGGIALPACRRRFQPTASPLCGAVQGAVPVTATLDADTISPEKMVVKAVRAEKGRRKGKKICHTQRERSQPGAGSGEN